MEWKLELVAFHVDKVGFDADPDRRASDEVRFVAEDQHEENGR